MASVFKGLGYLVSAIAVVLLDIATWKSASEYPWLLARLIAGMAASVLGMTLRWIAHRIDQKEKKRIEAKAESGSFSGRFPAAGWESHVPAGGAAAHA